MHEVRTARPILWEHLNFVGVDGCTMNVLKQLRDCQNRLIEVIIYSEVTKPELQERLREMVMHLWEMEREAEELKDDIHRNHGAH